jgi:amino acid adenylation domain-containing protein/non-ribosomal peptide synthase protein (TIGR01720 family)
VTTVEFLSQLRDLDVRLWVQGDRLRFNAPDGAVTPELRAELIARKTEIIAFLREVKDVVVPATPPIRPISRDAELPLSFAQQRMVFLDQLVPDNPFYNMPIAQRLTGQLDVAALRATLDEIIRRHETLRTTFSIVDGRPVQTIAPALPAHLPVVDLRELSEREREILAQRLVIEETLRPFDLAHGPMMRTTLLWLRGACPGQSKRQEYVLLLTIHHIVSDGWSTGVLFKEMSALYKAFSNERPQPSPLPALPVQYVDLAAWQREWLQGEVLDRHLAYWKQKLDGAPAVLELPADRPRPPIPTYRGATHPFTLSRPLTEGLKQLSQQEGATLFMTLLAAFKTLLWRYTGQLDVVVGSPIANRNRSEAEGLIGFFVNTLVLRTDLSDNPTFRELLGRVRKTALEAYAHQDLPFEVLVEELQPQRDMSRNPLVQVSFALQNAPTEALNLPGLTLKWVEFEYSIVRFDVELHLWETAKGLAGSIVYSTDLFDTTTIDAMMGHLRTLLQGIVVNPDRRLADLPILTDAERHQLLLAWNHTAASYPQDQCVHELFEAQVMRTPQAQALVLRAQRLTYEALNRRANQLAHYLRELGVGPEVLVGVCVERSVEMVVGVLGVLKAGGAYVPLDPTYPQARLTFMLDDAQVPVLLTQARLVDRLPIQPTDQPTTQPTIVHLDAPEIAQQPDENLDSGVRPENPAYVIYTSGSTGVPKGVTVLHRGVVNYLSWCQRAYPLTGGQGAPVHSSISFDLTVTSLFAPLVTGQRVQLVPEDIGVDALSVALKNENDYSLVKITPAHLQLLSQQLAAQEAAGRTRAFIIGGENLLSESLAFWQTHAPDTILVNEYGPTETVVGCCVYQVPAGERREGSVPIGRPINNTQLYILDAYLNPVPAGAPGELHIGGAGLARGYLNRPELTADKFIPNPFPLSVPSPEEDGQRPGGGTRLYKTGDLVRYLPDGNIEFLGRMDHQVKIRSYRIELGEIEAVLAQHPAVREVVALARKDEPGDRRLVAYVVANPLDAGSTGQKTDWDAEQIASWQEIYNNMYGQPVPHQDPTFNIVGWNSSYSGEPIPAEEMREWVENAVERVLSLKPRRVLEIGCGTGLLLYRIAPHCTHYMGTDFSEPVLSSLQQNLDKRGLSNVTLSRKKAGDLEDLEAQAFDAVILNSVIQYFPSVEYLLRVLEGAVRVTAPGGFVFVGDVRSLPLLEAFHASVQLEQASFLLSLKKLRQQMQQSTMREKELVVDPAFFMALRQHLPRVSHVEILPKRGRARNELTKFRYEVILHVDTRAQFSTDHEWVDWQEQAMTLPDVRRMLIEKKPETLSIKGVPNSRVLAELKMLQLLNDPEHDGTASELWQTLQTFDGDGVEPEDLRALGDQLGYVVEISWPGGESRYDVVFCAAATRTGKDRVSFFPDQIVHPKQWKDYTNDPLLETLTCKLVPQLRSFLKENLPEYMIPSAFVMLDALPLTPNGKIDRPALPEPEGTRPELESAYVAPRNETEQTITAIWEKVLRIDRIGVHDNFFDLGGDSILSLQIIARINQAGLQLTLRQIFEHQTVAELATVASAIPTLRAGPTRLSSSQAQDKALQAEQGLVTGPLPLTPIQHWFFEQDFADAHHFNQALLLQMRHSLDPAVLKKTVRHLLAHHDGLRLRFNHTASAWQQVMIGLDEVVPFVQIDLSDLSPARQEAAIETTVAELQSSLDFSTGPLTRVAFIELGEQRSDRLFIVIHHLAVDGVSWRILMEDLESTYRQLEQGKAVQLAPKTTSFKQWAEQLAKHAQSKKVKQTLAEWLNRPWERVSPLPVDHCKGANTVATTQMIQVSLDVQETQALLQEVPQAYGTQINDVLLAALAQACAQWTGQDLLLIDLEGHGREEIIEGLNLSRTVGWFTSTFPVLLDVRGTAGPGETLKAIKEQIRQIPNKGIDYGLLRYLSEEAEIASRLEHLPQPEVLFNYLGQLDQIWSESSRFSLAFESSGPHRSPRGTRRHILEINGGIHRRQLQLTWAYSRNLHHCSTIESLAQDYVEALRAIIIHCQSPQAGGYTPSDFARVKLSPEKLEKIFAEISLD